MKSILHGLAWALGIAAFAILIGTEFANPEMTRAQLAMSYWPRFIGALMLVVIAIIAELAATWPTKVRR